MNVSVAGDAVIVSVCKGHLRETSWRRWSSIGRLQEAWEDLRTGEIFWMDLEDESNTDAS